jgi:hypothetical protein
MLRRPVSEGNLVSSILRKLEELNKELWLLVSKFVIAGYGRFRRRILLVNGDLSIQGGFSYNELVVATGRLTLAGDGSISLRGAVISAADLSVDSTASPFTSVTIAYDSCAVSASFRNSPQGLKLLASRELGF